MGVISLLYYYFQWNNEEINIFAIFYQQKSREEGFKCFEGKIDAKTRRKSLEEKLKKWTAHLARHPGLACARASRAKNLTTKPKGAHSAGFRAKCEVNMKIKLPNAYIRRRKHKGKTHRVWELSKAWAYPLGETLFLSPSPFSCY